MSYEEIGRNYNTSLSFSKTKSVEVVKYYYSEIDNIEIAIPIDGSSIAVLISGGADSALTTYMLVKTVKDLGFGNKVYPITAEKLRKPFNIKHAWTVLNKIEELLDFKFDQHLIFSVPNHLGPMSDEETREMMRVNYREYVEKYDIACIFNGLTANPPEKDVEDNNTEGGNSSKERFDIEGMIQKLSKPKVQYPFMFTNKKTVSYFYKKYKLLDTLLPITRSCESGMLESEYFTKDCFEIREEGQECWWCRERKWAFGKDRPEFFIGKNRCKTI